MPAADALDYARGWYSPQYLAAHGIPGRSLGRVSAARRITPVGCFSANGHARAYLPHELSDDATVSEAIEGLALASFPTDSSSVPSGPRDCPRPLRSWSTSSARLPRLPRRPPPQRLRWRAPRWMPPSFSPRADFRGDGGGAVLIPIEVGGGAAGHGRGALTARGARGLQRCA